MAMKCLSPVWLLCLVISCLALPSTVASRKLAQTMIARPASAMAPGPMRMSYAYAPGPAGALKFFGGDWPYGGQNNNQINGDYNSVNNGGGRYGGGGQNNNQISGSYNSVSNTNGGQNNNQISGNGNYVNNGK